MGNDRGHSRSIEALGVGNQGVAVEAVDSPLSLYQGTIDFYASPFFKWINSLGTIFKDRVRAELGTPGPQGEQVHPSPQGRPGRAGKPGLRGEKGKPGASGITTSTW